MAHLQLADDQQVDRIYRESHGLWGGGLSEVDYLGLWAELMRTPWARKFARFYVWTDDRGSILSSLKLYRPRVRVLDRTARASVLGAIFTPRDQRCQGHAARLVRVILDQARESRDLVALLFSDIGTGFYREFGFRPLPSLEQWGPLPRTRPAADAALKLRPVVEQDAPQIRAAHAATSAGCPIAVLRDREHWHFLQVRSESFFNRIRDRQVCQRVRAATLDGRFAGYLVTVEGCGEWNVREVAAGDADPRTMARILRAGADDAARAGLKRVYAWLPKGVVAQLPDWRLKQRPRRRAIPMILPLDRSLDVAALQADSSYIPFHDQF